MTITSRATRHQGRAASIALLLTGTVATAAAAAAGAAAAAEPAEPARSAAGSCAPGQVSVSASATAADDNIVAVHVTNRSGVTCAVDRFPTVTFGDLDGTARPVPAGDSAPYRLAPGETAHAAVRTAPDMDSDGTEVVQHVTVAASPAHDGSRFTACEVGLGDPGIYVYDPITTWWHPAYQQAAQSLREHA
ncbi:DUF4232 domain-containing protein [Haloactinopolyspora alba]|nr:DUF4232 domain-containing protein [Haloactinopolyspora alba]